MLRLTAAQRAQFATEGYVVVPDLLPAAALDALEREIASLVDTTAQRLVDQGTITDRREGEGFTTRLTRLLADRPELRGEYLRAIEGKGGGQHAGPALFAVLTHPALLDAMEDLVGPEIVGSSVYRIRPKVPGLDRGVVPWHQDSGYFAAHCDDRLIVTCWIPLVDATPENGCLQVLPRTHRQGVVRHCTGGPAGYLVIQDEDLPGLAGDTVTVPVPRGGALLMTNLTPHCSTINTTDTIRWSIDLRYQARDVPSNIEIDGDAVHPDNPEIVRACYPPEGDFLVRSAENPERVFTYPQFVERRTRFENAALPGPNRGWVRIEA
jgi:hypothetical protein